MCGIVGILQYESEIPREIRHRALKILFSDTMLKTESRGEDATGIYEVHKIRPGENYGDWMMTKKGLKVSKWLFQDGETSEDPAVYSDFMDAWLNHDQELTALVGHCRKATVGSRGRDNDDNHPFAIQLDEQNAILGIHNGTLTNHERIFSNLPKMLKRQGQVDSEAIFHLMFHLSEHGTKPWDTEMMVKLGRRLDGAAACIVVNTRFPNIVATWRFGRPMEYILIAPLNIVLICSEKKFAEAALDKYKMYRQLFDKDLPTLSIYATSLTEKDYRIFDTSKPWPSATPAYQDLNSISVRGDMKPFNLGMEEGWYIPSTTSKSTGGANGSVHYSGGGAARSGSNLANATQAKTTKTTTPSEAVKALPATTTPGTASSGEDAVIVEVEIGSQEESEKAIEKAKSLGLCTTFDLESDIAKTIGLTQTELDKLTKVQLANLLAKAHFNLGYAVSRFDTKTEVEKIRRKGRELTKRLEKAEEKKKRSENRIWELKQLITIMLALNDSNYTITKQNIKISLSALSNLTESRKSDIAAQVKSIFSDRGIQSVVEELRKKYRAARQKKENRQERAANKD